MRFRGKRIVFGALAAGALAAPSAVNAQELRQPEGWRTRAERFVAMPPGFHITTSPAVLFYHPEAQAEGEYSVYSDGFLFPGESPNTYGLFIGGADLDGDGATWTSFEIGLDGRWIIRTRRPADRQRGFEVVEIAGSDAGPITLPAYGEPAKNALLIRVAADTVEFAVNGETVSRLARSGFPVEGVFGFRVGAGLNLHLTTLSMARGDYIVRWAPERPDATEGEDR